MLRASVVPSPLTAGITLVALMAALLPVPVLAATELPAILVDGEGFLWDIQRSGAVGSGSNHNFDGAFRLWVNGTAFPAAFDTGESEEGGRELVIGPAALGDLNVTRKVFVPADEAFIRYLEIIENPGQEPVEAQVRIETDFGADLGTWLVKTDLSGFTLTPENNLIIIDDVHDFDPLPLGPGRPAFGYLFSGRNAPIEPEATFTNAFRTVDPIFDNPIDQGDDLRVGFALNIPAGGRAILMHFGTQGRFRRDAEREAMSLLSLQGSSLEGLSPEEQAAVVNFKAYPDKDLDGLSDDEEAALGTDPDRVDSDGDTMRDPFEVKHGLDPLDSGDKLEDPDGDGLLNSGEHVYDSDPHKADTDGDGLSDYEEGLIVKSDPRRTDTDRDGLDDGDEVGLHATDPTKYDTDGDLLSDGDEINLHGSDPKIVDTDGGGRPDGYEVLADETDPADAADDIPTVTSSAGVLLIGLNFTTWYIRTDGTVDIGPNSTLDEGLRLFRVNGYSVSFNSYVIGMENSGKELVIGPARRKDLVLFRKVFVPVAQDNFARHIEIVANPSPDDLPVKLRLRTVLGSGANTVFVSSSSGDDAFDPSDDYIITDDWDGAGKPAVVHAISDPYARLRPFEASTTAPQGNLVHYGYETVVPAGGRVMFMHLLSLDATRAGAAARADDLVHLQGLTLESVSGSETDRILNFLAVADVDDDGLSDEMEAAVGTDPGNPDTDGDGIWDGFEVRHELDPLWAADAMDDADADGLNNLQEFLARTNPKAADTDGDGLGDADEIGLHGTDPLVSDTDGDGLGDGEEILFFSSSPFLEDTDGDNLPDEEEARLFGTDCGNADTDGDGLQDGFEADGALNAFAVGDESDDPDGDGLDNAGEQASATDPRDWDTDDDFLSDGDEVNLFGSAPLLEDTDGGGRTDGQEALADETNPLENGDDLPPFPSNHDLVDAGGTTWSVGNYVKVWSSLDEGLYLSVDGHSYASVSTTAVGLGSEEGGREFVSGPKMLGDLRVVRKVFVPTDDAFVRTLDIFDNPTSSNKAAVVDIRSDIWSYGYTPKVAGTSSGDLKADATDDYVISDDSENGGIDPYVHVFSGPFPSIEPSSVVAHTGTRADLLRKVNYTFDIVVPAGGQVALLHFIARRSDIAAAVAAGESLRRLGGSATYGLSERDRAAVLNFFALLDSDGDLLGDDEEIALGTDPENPDSDGDGLIDGEEVKGHGTDPLDSDTDDDGLEDGEEVDEYATSPLDRDSDGDGLEDGYEVFVSGTNPASFTRVWNIAGEESMRIGSDSSRNSVTGHLYLSDDHVYLIRLDDGSTAERGAWFTDRTRLNLFPQNILQMVEALETALEVEKGEPVQFSVESLSRSASLNSRTDAVSVTLQTRGTILLMNSGETERYDHKVRLAGGRDLDAGGALPAGVSLSAGVERARARTGVAEGTLDISSLGKPPITYLLTGTAQLRVNSTRATVPVNGSLVLNADRTYILGSDGDEVPETGVWFKGGKGLVLFQQNLLEQLEVVREIYAQPPGKPLEINVTRLRNSVRLNQKTDTLSLRSEIRMNLFYPQKGSQVALSISASLLGTLAFP